MALSNPFANPYTYQPQQYDANTDLNQYAAFNRTPMMDELARSMKREGSRASENALAQASKMGVMGGSAAANIQSNLASALAGDIAKMRYQGGLDTFKEQLAQKQAADAANLSREEMALKRYLGEQELSAKNRELNYQKLANIPIIGSVASLFA